MKKRRFKIVTFAVLAAFVLVLFSAGQVQAQGSITVVIPKAASPAGPDAPALNFVPANEALALLENQNVQLKDLLLTMAPGTAAYKDVETGYEYFNAIWIGIQLGKGVPASIDEAVNVFQTPYLEDTPLSQQIGLVEEAIDLLSN